MSIDRSEVTRFLAGARRAPERLVTDADLERLPGPIRRYLQYTGAVGTAVPATVRMQQRGTIRQGPGRRWNTVAAEEYFTTDPSGLLWIAKARTSPFMSATVLDRYQGGSGRMTVQVMGRLTVADDGSPEMNASSLVRYLNELMWIPAVMATAPITWDEIDDHAARASLRDGPNTATGTFHVDAEGRLTNFSASRFRQAGRGRPSLQSWSVPVSDFGERAGLRLPVRTEAVWSTEKSEFTYVRLHTDAIDYNVPEPF
jgi:hypothetical protein